MTGKAKIVKSSPVQTGVDTRRWTSPKSVRRSGAQKWIIDLYDAGSYICELDGVQYIFTEVLTSKARRAGVGGVVNALYRLFAAPNASVLLYGVKAVDVATVNASGWIELRLHYEQGTDAFTEANE